MKVSLAWKQLVHDPFRLVVALLGVGFAVLLMLMQLGFQDAMLTSAVRYHERLVYDLAIVSPKTVFIGLTYPFSRRRLFQAGALEGVEAMTPVYAQQQHFRNPWQYNTRNLLVVGVDPGRDVLATPGLSEQLHKLQRRDVVLFDRLSRPEFGPIAEHLPNEIVEVEIADRHVEIVGLFDLGVSFGVDGNVFTSDLNFLRIFPGRPAGSIDLGLVHLEPGADLERIQKELIDLLQGDLLVLTREQMVQRELAYWKGTTPVGYVFGFGLVMGLVVGGIIVYQILFADVSDHLREFATLKAIGYSDGQLAAVVLKEALLLASMGFLPGVLMARLAYGVASEAILMPLSISVEQILAVLALTMVMCSTAALIALRKLREADPADVF